MNGIVQSWSDHLRRDRRRSVHTIRAYAATADRLLSFLRVHQGGAPDLSRLEASDLRAFLASRRGDGLTNTSTARELSAVRAFLKFAGGEDAVPRLKGPRVKRTLPRPISPDDAVSLAQDVAEQAREPWIAARDWAILLLLYGAGLRISEALGLMGDVLPFGETLSVTGKRQKTRIVPLLAEVRSAIEAYVDICPYGVAKGEALFRGSRGGPLEPGTVRRAVRAARVRLNLGERTTPMPCATALRAIYWRGVLIFGAFKNFLAMPACRQRRSIRPLMRPIFWTSIARPIHALDRRSGFSPYVVSK